MQLQWTVTKNDPELLKHFLKAHKISKRLLARIKFNGGKIYVNHVEQTVRYTLQVGDIVTVVFPQEHAQDNVYVSNMPIDIIYEDDYVLVVNKPAGITSIPSYAHPNYSMANRVKGYYVRQAYKNQVIHVVTRLDKHTSGVMVFAKHQFIHALLDEQLRQGDVDKRYAALSEKAIQGEEHGVINAPIERAPDSLMLRQVSKTNQGKIAITEYWKQEEFKNGVLYYIKLHTGRTHQIRVHFKYKQATLLGDDLYGGAMDKGLDRQALHCYQLSFYHPITQDYMHFNAKFPEDMENWLIKERIKKWTK
ncbi:MULTISPECIES: RluA family pseudouridine synthase [unclassified Granulicatella]|uniref:RluA family pseudouridine synthase n=1 Tax=unclassified Granulicatella TaxID=2630493 RepID=UPI001073ADDC|nr:MULTISPECIES: RluA family pseudouridine synthase [unclassified Granulicatella]MBF0779604.1 RluA family pseudouridine synthase [Granulicatella sp. 19428wC4_WM01]TFU96403.1 RluA family pseudouridine synthase [Granulicatella sp. WM01]